MIILILSIIIGCGDQIQQGISSGNMLINNLSATDIEPNITMRCMGK